MVRTQCEGEPPEPDVEGWLAAGRPDSDVDLAGAWDLLNLGRYGSQALSPASRSGVPDPAVAHLDEVLRTWPHLRTFVTTYARVEQFIEAGSRTLPPLTA